MKVVSAAEANRHFSEVLRQAAQGATILITSRGKAVATLGPATSQSRLRRAARATLLRRLGGKKPSGKRTWTRSDLYE